MLENETLIKNIIRSLLPALDKTSLVLLTAGSADYKAYQQTIDELMLTEAKIAVTPAFYSFIPPATMEWIKPRMITEGETLYRELEQVNLIIIPVLTRNTLAKCAMGIQDNLVSSAIARGFMTGIPILAVKENCSPESLHTREKGMNRNHAYNQMLLAYEEKWKEFGAVLVGPEEFNASLKGMLYPELMPLADIHIKDKADTESGISFTDAKVITMGDVQVLCPGQKIRVSSGVVITPLAKEVMEEKQVIVEQI